VPRLVKQQLQPRSLYRPSVFSCRFSHDPGSGLAGVLFKRKQRIAVNVLYRLVKQFLLGDVERLDSGCQSTVGDCQYLEYPPLVKRGYEVSSSGGELPFSHADSFPQVGTDCYSCGFQTAPLPTRAFLVFGNQVFLESPKRSKKALKNKPVVRRRWRRLLENLAPQPNVLKGVPKSPAKRSC